VKVKFGFSLVDIPGSALTAERLRLDIISNNIANVDTTRTPAGGPYKRRFVVFEPILDEKVPRGVRVAAILTDNSPPRLVYDPSHPDANTAGYVAYPNIDIVTEMVDLIGATRAYEANSVSLSMARSMYLKTLEIGR